jgi:transcriptional regulator with XRE-family HTH domain
VVRVKKMSKEHFSYRKVTPEMVKKMKELRKQGLTTYEIAEKLGVAQMTVLYHLNPKYRKKTILRSKKEYELKGKSSIDKEYIREYLKKRYSENEEFREKVKERLREQAKKRHELVNELRKEYQEYNEAWLNYFKNVRKLGYKEAYKIFKQKVLELRNKYNVNFPFSM